MQPSVHYSTVHNSQEMEATLMSKNRGLAREDVVHTYIQGNSPQPEEDKTLPFAVT